ncbi:MAG: HD domain-containing protein [Myxococcota bacterium]
MDVIKRSKGDGVRGSRVDQVLAAALFHDIGHGPFSHAFEDVGKKLSLKLANHEYASDRLIRDSELSEVLRELGSGFANDVADIIARGRPGTMYEAVVSSQFDADRLDYMQRDRLMTGTLHGAIDFTWAAGEPRN